ncbi:hypothetical protein ACVWXU_001710 [Streptomyces sp. TE33382]
MPFDTLALVQKCGKGEDAVKIEKDMTAHGTPNILV